MVTKSILCWLMLVLPGSLIGQVQEFHALRKLSPDVNTVAEEAMPLRTPDGSRLYFTRALYAGNSGGKFSGTDIWVSESGARGWMRANNSLPVDINDEGHNAIVGMNNDGSKLYFMSARTDEKMSGIYVTSRISNYWTRPDFIPVPGIDNQSFVGIYVSPDLDVILLSMKAPDSQGEEDLYFSIKDASGRWSAPRNMGSTINTTGFEISPFLSADKKRLYFASSGHGGEGDADIFYSDRLYDSWETWSVPANLGKVVNSKKFDAYFSIYGDSVAYFCSNRDGKFADIYEVSVTRSRTVLEAGQHYLSTREWNEALGGAVANEIVFDGGSTRLSSSQKELVFYIANRLQLRKGILFHLIATEEDKSERTQTRLDAVATQLIQAGIDEARIITEQVEPAEKTGRGKVAIRLIE